ncbi:VWA domain-containing protein [Zhongshania sp.]|uniref:vWA domain-containing protein n=1 Tax=Zhongshania sp. TaxID=1971902 RepID=UPI00356B3729
MNLPSLHWIRPDLLWTIIPLLIAALLLAKQSRQQGAWHKHIDPSLLPYLLDGQRTDKPARSIALSLFAALLAWLALLGPAWQQAPTPLYKNSDGLVVVLDLSPSMLAEDIQPSRIRQARFKLRDLLQLRQDGQTGLVVFAADAFVVAPLTDDINTLLTLIPGLHPGMMPQTGSNPLAGLILAKDLLDQSGGDGRILLISDGVNASQLKGLTNFLKDSPYTLSVLAVGSRDGAPIPLPDGGFAKDNSGNIIVPALSSSELKALASTGGGVYRELSLDDSDIRALNPDAATLAENAQDKSSAFSDRHFDQWVDAGAWLVLLLLPIALLGFRRNWLPSLLLPLLVVGQPQQAHAIDFDSLWQTPDQRGAALFESDPAAAAEHFNDPAWKASAQYRAGDYTAAAESYAKLPGSDAAYNRGNALAKAGKLDEAIAAYEQALTQDPELSDAQRNKKIVEQLKKQQEQQEQNQSGEGDQNKDQQSQSSDQQNQERQDGQQQDPSNQEQQSQGSEGEKAQDKEKPGNQDQENTSSQDKAENNAEQKETQEAEQRDAKLAEDYAKQAAEQKPAPTTDGEANHEESTTPANVAESQQPLSEEDQSRELLLRQIPDNPGNLLRNKFQYQQQQRQQRGKQIEREDYAPY